MTQSSMLMPWSLFQDTQSRDQLNTVPARAFSQMNRNMEQMLDMWFNAMPMPGMQAMERMLPGFELEESADAFVFTAKMPWLKEEDLNIHVKNGKLHISAEQAANADKKDQQGNVAELFQSFASFEQTLDLPINADDQQIEADFEDGELSITVKKLEQAKANASRIEVNGAKKAKKKAA